MISHYDCAIVGGGLVGAALAVALTDSKYKIILIDAANLPRPEDHRLIALTAKSVDFFKEIDVWPLLQPHATAIKDVHVSQKNNFGFTKLSAADVGLTELGFVIPAKDINKALYEKLSKAKNITLLNSVNVKNFNQEQNSVILELDYLTEQKTQPLSTKILIAADGANSTIRKILNISTETLDYQQSALVTVTQLNRSHNNIAYERFHQTGALALLPLTNNRAATIWTDNTKNIEILMNLSDKEFVKKLQSQMGYRVGRLLSIDQRYTYPLQFMRIPTEQQIQNKVLILGNAAHTMHPIAAQGLNIALREINFLTNYLKQTNEINLPEKLPEQKNIQLSHQLTQIFAVDFLPFNLTRQASLVLLDSCTPIKRKFIRKMIGE